MTDTGVRIYSTLSKRKERLEPFKRVRRLEVYDLPKTISGKIRRVGLRQEEERRFKAGTRGPAEVREEDFPELR